MGHDISGYNKKGEEKAYIRYNFVNRNSHLLYEAFKSPECNGGVSGNGTEKDFTLLQVTAAKAYFDKLKDEQFTFSDAEDLQYEKDHLRKFIDDCLTTAKDEEKVRIFFG